MVGVKADFNGVAAIVSIIQKANRRRIAERGPFGIWQPRQEVGVNLGPRISFQA
jgi:hypothetical protein